MSPLPAIHGGADSAPPHSGSRGGVDSTAFAHPSGAVDSTAPYISALSRDRAESSPTGWVLMGCAAWSSLCDRFGKLRVVTG